MLAIVVTLACEQVVYRFPVLLRCGDASIPCSFGYVQYARCSRAVSEATGGRKAFTMSCVGVLAAYTIIVFIRPLVIAPVQ
jgi:hypothetical protein